MAGHARPRGLWLGVCGVVLAAGGVTLLGVAAAGVALPGRDVTATGVSLPSPASPTAAVAGLSDRVEASQDVPAVVSSAGESDGLLLAASEPVSIDIPAIGVVSVLRQVGLTAGNRLEVPAGRFYDDAAWYRHSVSPGVAGPAVIVGHVDSAADGPSVFFHLRHLEAGDEVFVARADGSVAVFAVDTVEQFGKDVFPTERVYGGTEHAGLRLITCGGVFDRSARSYVDNVVVFASLVGSGPAAVVPALAAVA